MEKGHESEDLKERLIMLIVYFRKEIYKITKRKEKVLKIYTTEATKQVVYDMFLELSNLLTSFTGLKTFSDDFSTHVLYIVSLITLGPSSIFISKTTDSSANFETFTNERPNLSLSKKFDKRPNKHPLENEVQFNSVTMQNNRYEGKLP